MGRRAMGRCRSRPSVGRRPRHAHRPLAGAHPRAHRHGRGIAIPQSAARAGSAAPSRRRSSISVAAERAKLSAAALFAATISAARDAVSGGAGTRRDRRCTGTGHAIVGAAVRTGHRRRSSCLSVTARRPLGSSTDANEPPPAVATTAPPRQVGAPLDLSSPSAPPTGSVNPSAGSTLPPSPPINPSGTGAIPSAVPSAVPGAVQAALPPGNTPKDQYDLAYGYVLHKDFTLAVQTFRDFLRKYPSDRLAPEAQYWLGESLFQEKQYRDAAESFLTVSTKYENTARAPDALLRLGQSLAALGEKEAACASLGEVLRKYPRAPLNVKQSVDREQKRTHC